MSLNFKKNYKKIRRVVVKVGTSTLTHSTGLLNLKLIENIVRQLADIHNKGIEVVLVTSGAIGAGVGKLGLKSRPKTIPEKQAAASVGQCILLHMYEKLFSEYGKTISQILLTKDDIKDPTRLLNAQNTFSALFALGVIPIINENDAVAVDEIKVGDNDTLSAMVLDMIKADLLILLTDIDGLYDSDPRTNENATLIKHVDTITKEIEEVAQGAGTNLGTGGMITKLKAAKIALDSGAAVVIANGAIPYVINRILDGEEIGTMFG